MMKNLMKLLAVISTLFVLQACSLTSTQKVYTQPLKELILRRESMLARVYVRRVIPDEIVDEMLSYYADKEDEFNASYGGFHTRNDIRNSNFLYVLTERSFGKLDGLIFHVDKSFNIQEGDILDLHTGQTVIENLITRKPTIMEPLFSWFGNSYSLIIPDTPTGFPIKSPTRLLSVVCRADDEGCDLNSTPATTIGYIRRLDSVADYRGVEVESLEPVLEPTGTSLSEALVINACPTCDDEKDIKELKELGIIK